MGGRWSTLRTTLSRDAEASPIPSTFHRAQAVTLGALVVGLAVLAPGAASAHQESAVRSPQAEKRLQAWERSLLGPGHAAAHAKVRALARATPRQRKLARKAASAGRVRIPWRAKRQHDASIDGNWGAPFPIPVMGIHGAVLPTGKVLWFSVSEEPISRSRPDPERGQGMALGPGEGHRLVGVRDVPPPIFNGVPANIWCAGQTHLADGSILVAGGNLEYSTVSAGFKGLNKMYTFDPFTETWTEQPDMAHGRWYPTLTRLGDGKVVITSGLDETGVGYTNGRNLDIEVFSPPTVRGGVGTLTLTGTRTPGDAGAPGSPRTGPSTRTSSSCRTARWRSPDRPTTTPGCSTHRGPRPAGPTCRTSTPRARSGHGRARRSRPSPAGSGAPAS